MREKGKLRYAGRVGSGYSDQRLDDLATLFKKHARATAPVDDVPAAVTRQARFIEPVLVAEISFRGWTGDGYVRQGAFKGSARGQAGERHCAGETDAESESRKARETVGGKSASKPRSGTSKDEDIIEGVRVTHPG